MNLNALQVNDLTELQEMTEEQRVGFAVTDLNSANWCLRKLQAINAKQAEINAVATAELARITEWRDKEMADLAASTNFCTYHLNKFHADQLNADPKAKTISTPYGKLVSRATKATPKKIDDLALLQHLKESGDNEFIEVKESAKWGDYKKTLRVEEVAGDMLVIDQNGVPVSGVGVEPGTIAFKVEVAE
ncbi:host-nuclease inhibitor Gam family protein [Tumebacillus permanentifrigoris]|uniref:Gam-like protein n=1 Tax=Tumebacillus permanentifrigoris TaxID=378543 RepID=A0A316DT59_9BACL|nr:host-nuclease inhibitor Gam family protein [Tumebacillus permanentifrigoris]PWK10199.1 Gam-like protein [Tumebacillus permanentifrigoris]